MFVYKFSKDHYERSFVLEKITTSIVGRKTVKFYILMLCKWIMPDVTQGFVYLINLALNLT